MQFSNVFDLGWFDIGETVRLEFSVAGNHEFSVFNTWEGNPTDALQVWYQGGYDDLGTADSLTLAMTVWGSTTDWYAAGTMTPASGITSVTPFAVSYLPENVGQHRAEATWTWGSTTWTEYRIFAVMGEVGGSTSGTRLIQAMHTMDRPEVVNVVWQTQNGELWVGQDPQ